MVTTLLLQVHAALLVWILPHDPSVTVRRIPQDVAGVRNEVYAVAETRTGGKTLRVDLYVPAERRIHGAVLLVHGGAFSTGARDISENQAYGRELAERGYLAAAMSYRLVKDEPVVRGWAADYARAVRQSSDPRIQGASAQYGPDFPEAVAASAEDVVAAVRWVRAQAVRFGFDSEKVALFGASAGAISSLTAAYAVDDYGGKEAEVAAVIALRGLFLPPAADAPLKRGDPALLILHGESDERVPPAYAERLFDLARRAGVYVEYFSAPGFGHELGGSALLRLHTSAGETVIDRVDAFLTSSFAGRRDRGPGVRGRLTSPAAQRPAGMAAATSSDFRSDIVSAVSRLVASVREPSLTESVYGISRRRLLLYGFGDPHRRDWSYWPRTRAGLPLRHMTAEQRSLTQNVLASILSAKGYLQVNHVMLLEQVLANLETAGFSRGIDDYTVAVFGMPGDEPWGFRFEGHHLSLNLTMTADAVTVTPSFFGAAPATLTSGARAGFGPLRYEDRAAFAFLRSLDSAQRAAAILSKEPPADILTGQFQVEPERWHRWQALLERDGLSTTGLDEQQLALFRRLLVEIASVYRDEIGAEYLSAIDPTALTFAWMGSSQPGQPHYFRIQGERFVFELDAAQEHGNHVHSVWRDRRGDFGDDALTRHYQRHGHQ